MPRRRRERRSGLHKNPSSSHPSPAATLAGAATVSCGLYVMYTRHEAEKKKQQEVRAREERANADALAASNDKLLVPLITSSASVAPPLIPMSNMNTSALLDLQSDNITSIKHHDVAAADASHANGNLIQYLTVLKQLIENECRMYETQSDKAYIINYWTKIKKRLDANERAQDPTGLPAVFNNTTWYREPNQNTHDMEDAIRATSNSLSNPQDENLASPARTCIIC